MKKSRFTESKIIQILKQHESGLKVGDICREHGISQATFFNWRAKYGGMSSSQLKRLKELEKENSQLKKCAFYLNQIIVNDKQVTGFWDYV